VAGRMTPPGLDQRARRCTFHGPHFSSCAHSSLCTCKRKIFHKDSSSGDRAFAGYLMALRCTGMVVELGQPLGFPSATDETAPWQPRDWVEYFTRKRSDFGFPAPLLNLAPVACFLTDHLSKAMTLHQCWHFSKSRPPQRIGHSCVRCLRGGSLEL
jgi:hypothetical protein